MINLNEIKITPRDQQVLRLLVQGCSNKEIASYLSISPRTVKQHLRTLFLRAGIKEGRKRVKLATAMFIKETGATMQPRDRLTSKEVQVAILVWQDLTNKDIARVLLTSEQVVKNYLRTAFDKLGVWTRLELALYVASHGGANWHMQMGNGLLPPGAGWSVPVGEEGAGYAGGQEKAAAAASGGTR